MDETSLRLSPRARRLAQELGIAPGELAGLGKSIVHEEDVRAVFARRGASIVVEDAASPEAGGAATTAPQEGRDPPFSDEPPPAAEEPATAAEEAAREPSPIPDLVLAAAEEASAELAEPSMSAALPEEAAEPSILATWPEDLAQPQRVAEEPERPDLGAAAEPTPVEAEPTISADEPWSGYGVLLQTTGASAAVEEDDAAMAAMPDDAAAPAAENPCVPAEEDETAPDDFAALVTGPVDGDAAVSERFEVPVAAPEDEADPVPAFLPAKGAAPVSEDETAPDDFETLTDGPPAAVPPPVLSEELIPLTPIRRIIAERAVVSAREVPQFSCWIDIAAGPVLPAALDPLPSTAVWVWAVARVLRAHRRLNASYTPEGIRLHAAIHVGVTLPLEEGIVVPVCHDADCKSITELTEELRDREERAQSRRLRGEQLLGATFTLSDWNAFGIRGGVPLIHPPQVATLGIGSPREVPMRADDGLVFRRAIEVVLVADQRALDAAHAAAFLTALKAEVEGATGG